MTTDTPRNADVIPAPSGSRSMPIDPRSSKGPRLVEPPTPDSVLAEAEHWMERLPQPPQPLYGQNEEAIEHWLHRCADAMGQGIEALRAIEWIEQPRNWPFGPIMRGRTDHIRGRMKRAIDDDLKTRRETEARQTAIRARETELAARKSRGWA